MMEPIRTGVIGLGGLGTRLAERVRESDNARVTAVAEIDDGRRGEVAESLGVSPERQFEDYEAMFDAVDLDAAVIATPHALHYEQMVDALENDLHVLCEKPFTVDLDHARDLVRRDEASDRVLMVGYQRHIEGPYVGAREAIDEWTGHPKFVTAELTQNWIGSQAGTWRANPALSGGGQLYDSGSHILDVVIWATGLTPAAVTASMVRWPEDRDVDTQAALTIEFEEDAVASVSVSGDAPEVREHFRAWGDDGAAVIDGRSWNDRILRLIDPDGAERFPGVRDRYPNKVEAFLEAIVEGTEPPATARHALAVTAVTEAAYEADRTGERVPVEL